MTLVLLGSSASFWLDRIKNHWVIAVWTWGRGNSSPTGTSNTQLDDFAPVKDPIFEEQHLFHPISMDITMDIHDILVEKYTIWYMSYYEYTCIFLVNFTAWWSNVIGNSKTRNISQWSLRSNVVVISSLLVQRFTTSKRLVSTFRSSCIFEEQTTPWTLEV